MNNIELTFCIPTYNRAQSVFKLVTDILICSDSDIEVVVLDNKSTDDTLRLLQGIKDNRLVIYSNDENKGGLYNCVHVLSKANGRFLVFLTDKDHVNSDEISKFKLFLFKSLGLAAGYCVFNSTSEFGFESFQIGFKAIRNIAYKGRHPTGYFFNNKLLKQINNFDQFYDYEVVDVFPMDFILSELCLSGNGAIYHSPIFTLETEEMAAKQKSYNASGRSKEAFFSPESRLKMAISYTQHMTTLPLTLSQRHKLIVDMVIRQFAAATLGYKLILQNKSLCTHYDMESRDVKIKELFSIGLIFYKCYINKTSTIWGYGFLNSLKFNATLFCRLCQKTMIWVIKMFSTIKAQSKNLYRWF